MALHIPPSVWILLEDDLSPEARWAVLRAGAPGVIPTLQGVADSPVSILDLDGEDARLVAAVLDDTPVLQEIARLDPRPEVQRALGTNPCMRAPRPLLPLEALLATDPSLEDLLQWHQGETSSPVSSGLLPPWLLGAPDPSFLRAYAQGELGPLDISVLFLLQDRPALSGVTLEMFLAWMDPSSRRDLLDQVSWAPGVLGRPLVEVLAGEGVALAYPREDGCQYTPEAVEFLLTSAQATHHAAALASLPWGSAALPEVFSALSPQMQVDVLFLCPDPGHKRVYAPLVGFSPGLTFRFGEPLDFLQSTVLDFAGRKNLLRHTGAGEILDYLVSSSLQPAEVDQLLDQLLSDVPQTTTLPEWNMALNQRRSHPVLVLLAERVTEDFPGTVPLAFTYGSYGGLVAERVRARVRAHCGADASAWESALSLAESWTGTLPELLECVALTR